MIATDATTRAARASPPPPRRRRRPPPPLSPAASLLLLLLVSPLVLPILGPGGGGGAVATVAAHVDAASSAASGGGRRRLQRAPLDGEAADEEEAKEAAKRRRKKRARARARAKALKRKRKREREAEAEAERKRQEELERETEAEEEEPQGGGGPDVGGREGGGGGGVDESDGSVGGGGATDDPDVDLNEKYADELGEDEVILYRLTPPPTSAPTPTPELRTIYDTADIEMSVLCGDAPDGDLSATARAAMAHALYNYFNHDAWCDYDTDEVFSSVTPAAFTQAECCGTPEGCGNGGIEEASDGGRDLRGDGGGSGGGGGRRDPRRRLKEKTTITVLRRSTCRKCRDTTPVGDRARRRSLRADDVGSGDDDDGRESRGLQQQLPSCPPDLVEYLRGAGFDAVSMASVTDVSAPKDCSPKSDDCTSKTGACCSEGKCNCAYVSEALCQANDCKLNRIVTRRQRENLCCDARSAPGTRYVHGVCAGTCGPACGRKDYVEEREDAVVIDGGESVGSDFEISVDLTILNLCGDARGGRLKRLTQSYLTQDAVPYLNNLVGKDDCGDSMTFEECTFRSFREGEGCAVGELGSTAGLDCRGTCGEFCPVDFAVPPMFWVP